MIAKVALIIFGWRRVPDGFARRFAEYIPMRLRKWKVRSNGFKPDCLSALANAAFESARKGRQENPRLVHLVREIERISDSIALARAVDEIGDQRVRSILTWHGVVLPLESTGYSVR